MIRAFYSGTSGLKAQQSALEIAANNIANVNTGGFKAAKQEFGDLLYNSMSSAVAQDGADILSGSGTRVSGSVLDMSDGPAQPTGVLTDFMIDGDGFFALEDASNSRYYTRSGSFGMTQSEGGWYLTNQQGLFVLDSAGQRISFSADGTAGAQPGVFAFSNSQGLSAAGGGLFTQTATSGPPTAGSGQVKEGFLEGSNVNLAGQMIKLISSQRDFQLSANMVRTADQVEQMSNELR